MAVKFLKKPISWKMFRIPDSVSSELDPLQSEIKNKDSWSFLFKKIERTRNSRKPKFYRLASMVRQKRLQHTHTHMHMNDILTAVALKSYDYEVVKQFCWSKSQ